MLTIGDQDAVNLLRFMERRFEIRPHADEGGLVWHLDEVTPGVIRAGIHGDRATVERLNANSIKLRIYVASAHEKSRVNAASSTP